MKITDVEGIRVNIPPGPGGWKYGQAASFGLVKVSTDEAISGYGFGGLSPEDLTRSAKPMLLGQDPFAIERHIEAGLIQWPSMEHALWDLVGKAAGQPAHRLLGGHKERIKVYLTCVWPGNPDQSDWTPEEQTRQAEVYFQHGFRAIKIRGWRRDPMEDVKAVRLIKQALGDEMDVMVDRTAHAPGWLWDYDTAYRVARELEATGAKWLEEPFDRNDLENATKLSEAVDIPITGGEGDRGLLRFREYLEKRCFDVVQPDAIGAGGILTIRKVSAIAEAFGKLCILHGSNSLGLAAPLQIVGAIPNCPILEIALVHPPLLPWEHWHPAERLIKSPPLYSLTDGWIEIPKGPGLGIELDEDAVERYRE